MALPTPREPECSITQTRSSSIEAHLDEVIARAERAEMVFGVGLGELRVLVDNRLKRWLKRRPAPRFAAGGRLSQAPLSRLLRPIVRPCGTACSMRRAHRCEIVGQVARRERGAHGHHSAADIDPDRGRNDRAPVGITEPTVEPLP